MSLGFQLSLLQKTEKKILENLDMSPQVIPMMIREKNYWAPSEFASYDHTGSITNIVLLPSSYYLLDHAGFSRIPLPTAKVG